MKRTRNSSLRIIGWTAALMAIAACGIGGDLIADATEPPAATETPGATIAPTGTLKPGQERGVVVKVIDGVTIMVELNGEAVKVCYEHTVVEDNFHPYTLVGIEAAAANRTLVGGKAVILEKDDRDPDRGDCHRRYVFLEDGTFVNAELLRRGLAHYSAYNGARFEDELTAAEQEAMALGLGWWHETPTPVRPPTMTPTPSFQLGQSPDWQDTVLRTICVTAHQYRLGRDYPAETKAILTTLFQTMGIEAVEPGTECDARLKVTMTTRPIKVRYGGNLYLWTAAETTGVLKLTSSGRSPIRVDIQKYKYPPTLISHSDRSKYDEKSEAPFYIWKEALLDKLVEIWGPILYLGALQVDDSILPYYALDEMHDMRWSDLNALPCVPALIGAYERGVSPYIQEKIVDLLEWITYKSFGHDIERWREWWESESGSAD